jgi:hypothetical protein
MNITQTNIKYLLKEASFVAAMLGTSPIEIKVSLPKDLVQQLLEESSDFYLEATYLSETELEIEASLSKIVITIL